MIAQLFISKVNSATGNQQANSSGLIRHIFFMFMPHHASGHFLFVVKHLCTFLLTVPSMYVSSAKCVEGIYLKKGERGIYVCVSNELT